MNIVLFEPEIAPNVGTIARTCACLNAALHIIHPCGFPFDSKRFKRAAMDYWHLLTIHHYDSWQEFLQKNNARTVLMDTKSSLIYWDFKFQKNDFLIAGKESTGVPDHVFQQTNHQVIIPMGPHTRSLNVAVAASIVLSEAIRQTSQKNI